MDRLESLGSGFSKEILDKFEGIAYISDVDTYDFIYINKHFRELLNIKDDSYLNKKCYEVLHKKDAPCEFCINSQLRSDGSTMQLQKQILDHPFEAQVSLIEWEDKKFRIEFGIDFGEYHEKIEDLHDKISTEQLLVKCAETLCHSDDIDNAFKIILENIVEFFESDRAYLYEYSKKNTKFKCTHFFVRPFVSEFKEILSEANEKCLQLWLKVFSDKSKGYLQNVQTDFTNLPLLKKAFEENDDIAAVLLETSSSCLFIMTKNLWGWLALTIHVLTWNFKTFSALFLCSLLPICSSADLLTASII